MNANTTNLLIAAGLLFVAIRYGSPTVQGLAFGAAGYMVANNLPLVQNGLQARLVTPAAAAA